MCAVRLCSFVLDCVAKAKSAPVNGETIKILLFVNKVKRDRASGMCGHRVRATISVTIVSPESNADQSV